MFSTDDVLVRRAMSEDHYAIVRNGDVYSGRDYLPAIFPRVVSDPDVFPVVAELKGQVVGFMMDHVIDGGMSVIRRATRTFPGYRNMGIMHKMSKVLDSLTEERFPDLRYRYECTTILDEQSTVDKLHLKGFTEIHRKRHIQLAYRTEAITGLDSKKELPDVLSLEYNDVKTLFTLDHLLEQLFPLKRVFNFYMGYRCLESNIKHVLGDDKEVCVTIKIPTYKHDTTKLSLLQDIDMVSFVHKHMGGSGLIYRIDIYAKEDQNTASLEAHILRHLRVLKALKVCDRGEIVVTIERYVSEETVRSLMTRCGTVERGRNADNWNFWFEKNIKPRK